MLKRQDIKEILIVLLLAAIAVGISEGAKYYFYEHMHDNNTVENTREDKIVLNSFCYASLGEDMQPETKCRWGTPEALMKLHGYMLKRRV